MKTCIKKAQLIIIICISINTLYAQDNTDDDWINMNSPTDIVTHPEFEGSIGIGTINPQGLVDINSGDDYQKALFVKSSPFSPNMGGIIHHQGEDYAWQTLAQNTATGISNSYLTYNFVDRVSPGLNYVRNNVFTLHSTGRVGVGTTSPKGRLDVNGGKTALDALWSKSSDLYDNYGGMIHYRNNSSYAWQSVAQLANVIPTASDGNMLVFNAINVTPDGVVTNTGGGGQGEEGDDSGDGGQGESEPIGDGDGEEDHVYFADVLVLKGDGKVGIGTRNPVGRLHVKGSYFTDGGTPLRWTANNWEARFVMPLGGAIVTSAPADNGKVLGFGMTNDGWYFASSDDMVGQQGNPAKYALHLNTSGKLYAREIEVTLTSPGSWPDYVFEKDYDLKKIDEVEEFIKQNKHLPDVPSQEDMVNNGLNLGEMDAVLLKKIEELTLYVIELQSQINELKNDSK